jgi:hypothetical protein
MAESATAWKNLSSSQSIPSSCSTGVLFQGEKRMRNRSITTALAVFALWALAGAAQPAFAAIGSTQAYVCQVQLSPPASSPAYGNGGYVTFRLHTRPGCAGTLDKAIVVFTSGATTSDKNTAYFYSSANLVDLYQSLVKAAKGTRTVRVGYESARLHGGAYQGATVSFSVYE